MIKSNSFTGVAKFLHWLTAAMVLAMIALGVTMMATLAGYHSLVLLHRPLGIAVLVMVVVRLVYRLFNPPPPLPVSIGRMERIVATTTEYLLYAVMLALPLVGWGMLSAARYPVLLFGSVYLPNILPHDLPLAATLRHMHSILAYVLVVLIFAHVGAILFHTIVLRDGLLRRMLPTSKRKETAARST
jgi:cytochrome b561